MSRLPEHPFVLYRDRLDVYGRALTAGWDDERFVETVRRLDEHVSGVDGAGFAITPLTEEAGMAGGLDLRGRLFVKDETGNVSGSHKARHLFGTMLAFLVDGDDPARDLAIASCGNAALAAAVVARAQERNLRVFIPTWADPVVVGKLEALGADITECERRPGEAGDPAFLRFEEAVAGGARAFSVQGPSTPTALDGGRTIGWEVADQLEAAGVIGPVRVFLQVGGGALASCAFRGILEGAAPSLDPRFHTVQGEACAPLRRAWRLLGEAIAGPSDLNDRGLAANLTTEVLSEAVDLATTRSGDFMWAWEEVGASIATGILDDVTYDWIALLEPLIATRGWPVVVSEADLVEANRLALAHTNIPVDATGSAGLAGLFDVDIRDDLMEDETVVVAFTGRIR